MHPDLAVKSVETFDERGVFSLLISERLFLFYESAERSVVTDELRFLFAFLRN